MREECYHGFLVAQQTSCRTLHERETQEHEGEADYKFTYILVLLFL